MLLSNIILSNKEILVRTMVTVNINDHDYCIADSGDTDINDEDYEQLYVGLHM